MHASEPLQHLLYFVRDPRPWGKSHEAAEIRHTPWQRGGVAARGARAAGDAGAAGSRLTALGRVSARLKRDWLRRGPNLLPAHRVLYYAPRLLY